ncbi:MAG: hypothetical protein JKY14_05615 [Paraglaciecola sp.]|nr:hypothetical protein [Paraglaciecola sp.]
MNESIVGVITGDIVDSQKIEPENYDNMLYTLERTFTELKERRDVTFEIYRGDAFQAIFSNPVDAVKSAVIIRLALKTAISSFDVRQNVGIGGVTSRRSDIKTSTGEAFTLSGKGLDNIRSSYIAVTTNNKQFQSKIGLLTKFLDAHLSGLTLIQSETLLCYLTSEDKSHEFIASSLSKTRSNTTKLLNAGHYQLIDEYSSYFDSCFTESFNHV